MFEYGKKSQSRQVNSARAAIASFVETNAPRFGQWLEQIADGIPKVDELGKVIRDDTGAVVWVVRPSPLDATKLVSDIMEFHLPKLSRQDLQVSGVIGTLNNLSPGAVALLEMDPAALTAHLNALSTQDLPEWLRPVPKNEAIDVEYTEVGNGKD